MPDTEKKKYGGSGGVGGGSGEEQSKQGDEHSPPPLPPPPLVSLSSLPPPLSSERQTDTSRCGQMKSPDSGPQHDREREIFLKEDFCFAAQTDLRGSVPLPLPVEGREVLVL
jgi:hypothetical protein